MALYVDHEPFNTVRTPDLCRVVNVDDTQSKQLEEEKYSNLEDYSTNPILYLSKHKGIYKKLVKNAMKYIVSRVAMELIDKLKLISLFLNVKG
jgi:hypothetical protein